MIQFHSINKKFINKGVSYTNKVRDGLKINTSRIMFVHGSIDPWRILGVTSTKKNKNLDVIVIKGKKVEATQLVVFLKIELIFP